MMKKILTTLLLIIPILVHGQKQGQEKIDSLLNLYKPGKIDSINLKILYSISFEYHRIDPTLGIFYGEKLMVEAKKSKLKNLLGDAYLSLGINYLAKNEIPKALDYEFMAVEIYEEIRDSVGLARAYNNIGNIYFNEGSLDKAMKYYNDAILLFKLKGLYASVGVALGNLGSVYQSSNNPSKALEYFKLALSEFEKRNDLNGQARMLTNIGNLYDIFKDHLQAIVYKSKGKVIYLAIGDKNGLGRCYDNLAYSYFHLVLDSVGTDIPDSLKDYKGNILKAKKYELLACKIAIETDNRNLLLSSYSLLAQIENLIGNHKAAYNYLSRYSTLHDSIYSASNRQKLNEIENRRVKALQKKELELRDLQLLTAKRIKMFLIWGILGLLLLVSVLVIYYFHQKKLNRLISNEKQKSENLLLNILPGEVADELKETGRAHAKQFKNVTVIFTDFVNFTGISENLAPSELIEEINRYYSAFDLIIEKNKLEKIKTIGDSYMAVCGLPVEDEKNAIKAINAGCEILKYVNESKGLFNVRVGLHSGPVVAGIVGVRKFAYDIWGDTVNTAARMEQNSEPGKINVSGATYELAKNEFNFDYRGKLPAKNKGEVDMYFVKIGPT